MSRCCCRKGYSYGPVAPIAPVAPVQTGAGCGCGSTFGGCNFACFIILILILLTFTNNNNNCCENDGVSCGGFFKDDNFGGIGKGLLFIIALYYLSCWIPCGRGAGAY